MAVDADTLPDESSGLGGDAATALSDLAERAEIVYLTSKSTTKHPAMHERFERQGYPDGAILRWRREYWRVDRSGRFRWPRVVVESRDEHDVWGTVGVHENVIEASWNALIDSIEYKLYKDERK